MKICASEQNFNPLVDALRLKNDVHELQMLVRLCVSAGLVFALPPLQGLCGRQ